MLNAAAMVIVMGVGLWITCGLGWTFSDPGLWGYLIACPVVGMLVWEWERRKRRR